ncbi:MAG: hypothetical protein U0798_10490 [Gemmataceae bacterium]
MATISIEYGVHLHEFSPSLCMRCGEPTELFLPVEFTRSNRSPLLFLLLLFGPLGHIAVALIPPKTERRLMRIPLCPAHQNHFNQNRIYTTLATFLVVLSIMGFAFLSMFFQGNGDELFIASILLIIVSTIVATWISRQKIRCTKITNQKIVLAGIHSAYAVEFQRTQAEFLEAFEAWRAEDRRKRLEKRGFPPGSSEG